MIPAAMHGTVPSADFRKSSEDALEIIEERAGAEAPRAKLEAVREGRRPACENKLRRKTRRIMRRSELS